MLRSEHTLKSIQRNVASRRRSQPENGRMYGGGALEKGAVGILVEEQLASSCNARDFPRLHPREARAALAAAVGTASVRHAAKHGDQYAGLPDLLRHFMGLGRSLGRDCRDFRSSFRSQDFAHRDLSMGTTSGGFLQAFGPDLAEDSCRTDSRIRLGSSGLGRSRRHSWRQRTGLEPP